MKNHLFIPLNREAGLRLRNVRDVVNEARSNSGDGPIDKAELVVRLFGLGVETFFNSKINMAFICNDSLRNQVGLDVIDMEKDEKKLLEKVGWRGVYGVIDVRARLKEDKDWSVGHCPFGQHFVPMFSFNTKTLLWKCFSGCGKGDAISFLMRSRGINYEEALDYLKEIGG